MKIKILLGIIFIFLIGYISASQVCCEKISGIDAWCIDAEEERCDSGFGIFLQECSEVSTCDLVYCLDPAQGICSEGVIESRCIDEGGEPFNWLPSECEKTCCLLYENTQYIEKAKCRILSENAGKEFEVDDSLGEAECRYLNSENLGACVYASGACKITNEKNCFENYFGYEFEEGWYCSDSRLNTICESHEDSGCVEIDQNVHWIDSCGQPEEIYENGNCEANNNFCNYNNLGNPECNTRECTDENGQIRKHGESWCYYEGYIGNVGSPPGTTHWLKTCLNGEIQMVLCDSLGGRNSICAQGIDNSTGFSVAKCRPNLGNLCFGIETVAECNEKEDCEWYVVDLRTLHRRADNFVFGGCIPKYPKSFNILNPGQTAEERCNLASTTCYTAWDEDAGLRGDDDRIANGRCSSSDFFYQMNNLCQSLGDCGGHISTGGEYSQYYNPVAYGNIESGQAEKELVKKFLGTDDYNDADVKQAEELQRQEIENYYNSFFEKENILDIIPDFFVSTLNFPQIDKLALPKIGLYRDLGQFREWILGGGDDDSNLWWGVPKVGIFKNSDFDLHVDWVSFSCLPWIPPEGGEHCSECNSGEVPCTRYKCESLGSSCMLDSSVVAGEDPVCYDAYPDEIIFPIISFDWIKEDYKFNEASSEITMRDGSGVLKNTRIDFKIKTEDYAICRYDFQDHQEVREFPYSFEEQSWTTSHEIKRLFVNKENPMRIYIKCYNIHQLTNPTSYLVNIKVSPQPDTKPPHIENFDPENNGYLAWNKTEIFVKLFLDAPAHCRYSLIPNQEYENMEKAFNCGLADTEEHDCSITLTNFINIENKIYIRCKDDVGNTNTEDRVYVLKSTPEPLQISVNNPLPNSIRVGRISKESPLELRIITSGGAYSGESKCKFLFWEKVGKILWTRSIPLLTII